MRLPTVEDIEKRLPKPEDFTSKARGTELTARVGTALGIAFGICFLTGIWSHYQYAAPGWLPIGPNPAQLYRVTQGLHVISGMAAIPLLLVKLWSVYPRLFILPPKKMSRELVIDLLEKASIGVLVSAGVFQLATGALNIAQWYPWEFSFRRTHEAVAWIVIGALLVHIAVKLPIIREALGSPLDPERDEPHDPTDHDEHAPTRRSVLLGASAASGLAVLLTAGQTVPFLRKVSVFGVRDGEGPQGLPINRTAKAAGAAKAAADPAFALEIVVGDSTRTFTRDELAALPQRTHRLPIACVEGWSKSALWTGVSIRDLIELAGGDPDSTVRVRSMQTIGAFRTSDLPADFVRDHRTLLALELNGETLSLDHGYPCRIIAPNRPGVLQTKWVRQLEVKGMREIRAALLALGVAGGLWGVWLMHDFTTPQLVSVGTFLVGGVILHDAILAPATVGLGVAASRLLPNHFRTAAGIGFLLWGTLTLAFFNVMSGQGGKPDNTTVLNRPYAVSWIVLTAVLAAVVIIAAFRRRRAMAVPASLENNQDPDS